MNVYLDSSKNYYKANLHCHSTNSDGKATPEQLKEEYMKQGYSVIAYTDHEHMFYIGRGIDSDLCAEGSLKLKEISYIHSEAYAAGELKHGTISLITDRVPVVALITDFSLAEKTVSGIREVRSRKAKVLAIVSYDIAERIELQCDDIIKIPHLENKLTVFPAATVLQLFAYHAAALRGLDVDKPRNLAKSVTVE